MCVLLIFFHFWLTFVRGCNYFAERIAIVRHFCSLVTSNCWPSVLFASGRVRRFPTRLRKQTRTRRASKARCLHGAARQTSFPTEKAHLLSLSCLASGSINFSWTLLRHPFDKTTAAHTLFLNAYILRQSNEFYTLLCQT